ncbi:MAG TPA: DUF6290 family protein [Candidatus Nanoarchaeia archaeon]|nr:DUF6290 family protein [Candidatus Nanoarchaeia archaeon]
MKTITIKLPEQEAKELDRFVKRHNYPSKSEFIRNTVIEKMETRLTKEALKDIQKSLEEIKQGKTTSLEEIEKEYGL